MGYLPFVVSDDPLPMYRDPRQVGTLIESLDERSIIGQGEWIEQYPDMIYAPVRGCDWKWWWSEERLRELGLPREHPAPEGTREKGTAMNIVSTDLENTRGEF